MTYAQEIADLPNRARRQGHDAGLNGRRISQLDWEEEYLPAYNSGYREGVAERERLSFQKTEEAS